MIKKPLSLFLALTAGAVLTTNAAPAAQSGSAAPKPAVPAGPTGTITWKGVAPQRAMLYVQKDNKLQPKSFAKDGTLTLPVGDYTIVYMNCQIDDCNVSVNYGPKAPKITVAEGKPVELEAIAAAALKVTAGAKGPTGEIALSLALTTADGIKLTCQNAKDPTAKPGFRILDAAG